MAIATRRNRALAVLGALMTIASAPASAVAQPGGGPTIHPRLASPAPFQVFQRDRAGKADVPITLENAAEGSKIVSARLFLGENAPQSAAANLPRNAAASASEREVENVRFVDGKLLGLSAGGPYTVAAIVEVPDAGTAPVASGPFFVGDLWVLAGQSNMEGYGDLIDVARPNPKVMSLGMDGKWGRAEEPLHWLVDSPDPVHSGDPATRAERSAQQHRNRAKGAGLGLAFADSLARSTGVPIGLVPCAHGGTSMAQWSPAKKDEGGNSLYGSMVRQVGLAGGKVKGVLWYQGESDANPGLAEGFRQTFTDFIQAVRTDFGQPELPFYYVQIGRFIRAGDPGPWNLVQDVQRTIPESVPNTAVISVIDLELDDLIHVGAQGLKRAGNRLANVARRELFGQVGATTPTFDRVNRLGDATLIVKFKGVNFVPDQTGATVALKPGRHVAGFSIRDEKGEQLPLIFDAAVGDARDSVVLKLVGPVPAKASLWYGHGLDPYCNLTDGADMAVPVFGPVPLDDLKN